ncbi:MAG: TIGR04255 family protein [bacterium]
MNEKTLKNNYLLESIFELRLNLKELSDNLKINFDYNLFFLAKMYERIVREYPVYKELPTSDIHPKIATYIIQHRFRKAEDDWPIVQIGPGIITLNDTKKNYKWTDFYKRINNLLDIIFEIYPKNLKINHLILRYINSIDYDYENKDILLFLKNNLI